MSPLVLNKLQMSADTDKSSSTGIGCVAASFGVRNLHLSCASSSLPLSFFFPKYNSLLF